MEGQVRKGSMHIAGVCLYRVRWRSGAIGCHNGQQNARRQQTAHLTHHSTHSIQSIVARELQRWHPPDQCSVPWNAPVAMRPPLPNRSVRPAHLIHGPSRLQAKATGERIASWRHSNGASYHQPPIQLQGLSGKYASALYSAAVKKDEKTLSTVEKDLSSIQRVLSSKDGASGYPLDSPQ
jgi:hypothetical protein